MVVFTPLNTAACLGVTLVSLPTSDSYVTEDWEQTVPPSCDDITYRLTQQRTIYSMMYARGVNNIHCLSLIVVNYIHLNNIQTSIINICCSVSWGGHAAPNKRHSLSVNVIVGLHTIIHLTHAASAKQYLIWSPQRHCQIPLYHALIHRTEWHAPSGILANAREIFQSFDIGWLLLQLLIILLWGILLYLHL